MIIFATFILGKLVGITPEKVAMWCMPIVAVRNYVIEIEYEYSYGLDGINFIYYFFK